MVRPFNRFVIASAASNFGDGIALVSWAWLASQLTRDPFLIALVPVALKLPWFMFSLPAGVIVDRFDRRRLIIAADILRVIAYLSVAVTIWRAQPLEPPPLHGTSRPDVLILIVICTGIVGVAEVIRDNAAQTMLPELVAETDLERANGRLWSVELITNYFIGTAVAGLLIGISLVLPFAVIAMAMIASVGFMSGIRGSFAADHPDATGTPPGWMAELREGIAFLLSHPILAKFAILTGFYNFLFSGMQTTLVLIVQERLQLGAFALSAIMASGAVGGVLAGLINHQVVNTLGRSRVLQAAMISIFAFPLSILLTGSGMYALLLVCAGFFVSEFWGLLWNTVTVSYRQRHIPRRLLGRVNSAYRLFAIGMAPLGMLAAGALTRWSSEFFGREVALGAPFVMAILIAAAITIYYWRFLGNAFKER